MIDLISYKFQEDVPNNLCNVTLKYTDGKEDKAFISGELMCVLEKDDILELLKDLHKV